MAEERPYDGEQARRLIYIYNLLIRGSKLTSDEILQMILDTHNAVSLRTVQRDLKLLQDIVNTIETKREGHKTIWYIPQHFRAPKSLLSLSQNDLILFHLLKAHLKSFKGTKIEDDVKTMLKKLEKLAPGNIYLDEALFWDQNVGIYDYSKHGDLISDVIKYINDKKFVKINYSSTTERKEKIYDVLFRKIFQYEGSLYIAALIPKYNKHIPLKIQNIKKIELAVAQDYFIPEFKQSDFVLHRFGVFGDDKVQKVVLQIEKSYEEYFENRIWHSTQKFSRDENGLLHLSLMVPLAPDFISWLASWCEHIKIISPDKLISALRSKLESGLEKNI